MKRAVIASSRMLYGTIPDCNAVFSTCLGRTSGLISWSIVPKHCYVALWLQSCPHQTVDCPEPSGRMAANAPLVAWICCTHFSWSWTHKLSPPLFGLPHVTTEPSSRIAANAVFAAWICCTLFSSSWTAELSPPHSDLPHVTTESSSRMAANAFNAPCVAWIFCTQIYSSLIAEKSWPKCGLAHITTAPFCRMAANARLVAWICCTHTLADLGRTSCPTSLPNHFPG